MLYLQLTMYEAPRLLMVLPVGEGWRKFLRARAEIVYKFLRNFFACP